MLIYLHNRHTDPLAQVLRGAIDSAETPAQQEAILTALARIEEEKQTAPYRLWERDQSPFPGRAKEVQSTATGDTGTC